MEYYLFFKKEGNSAMCSNMDESEEIMLVNKTVKEG